MIRVTIRIRAGLKLVTFYRLRIGTRCSAIIGDATRAELLLCHILAYIPPIEIAAHAATTQTRATAIISDSS